MVKHFFYGVFNLIVLTFLLTISIHSQNIRETEKSIKNAGMKELSKFLGNIPIGQEKQYGFENRDQFNEVAPGKPIRLYTLSDESGITNTTEIATIPQNTWFLPLIVNSKYVALLTVAREGDNFSAVDFGAKDLAAELNDHQKEIESLNNSTGLLRVYNLQSDLFIITAKGKPDIINSVYPLTSAQTALKLDASRIKKMTVKETELLICEKLVQLKKQNSDK